MPGNGKPMDDGRHMFETGLERTPANFQPQSPLVFLPRSVTAYGDRVAVIDGMRTWTYAQFYERCVRFASALTGRGIGPGHTVAVMARNVPALLEAHYGIPMAGAVINALNIRLDAASIAFILEHAEARLFLVDRAFASVARDAVARLGRNIAVVDIADPTVPNGKVIEHIDYEEFVASGDPDFRWSLPDDEWQAIALNYTSGTTGDPKGAVYHHRGAFVNALGNALVFGLNRNSVYLWILPIFHCNGWTYTWAVTAVGGTHVCLPTLEPTTVFAAIRDHGVTHMCGAPIVLNMLVHAPEDAKVAFPQTVEVATGGASPPRPVIAGMEKMGFHVTHLYGLTETYGPATVAPEHAGWADLSWQERTNRLARQGVRYPTLNDMMVADPETFQPVPTDGTTIGELMLRGSTVMKGYLKNPKATQVAFAGGWFHTGDLAVVHPDGSIEIKDRSKDIIISGGENISSLEIEEVLYRHPAVMEAAVVAMPDEKWGERPCAFITLKDGAAEPLETDIIAFCRDNMAHFKAPSRIIYGPLPKTETGKIQKFTLRDRARQP